MDELVKLAAISLVTYFVPRTLEKLGSRAYETSHRFRSGYHRVLPDGIVILGR